MRLVYHATLAKNVGGILSKGLVTGRKPTFHGTFGKPLGDRTAVYGTYDADEAARLAAKLRYEGGEPSAIVVIDGSNHVWVRDEHFEGRNKGWVEHFGDLPVTDIIAVVPNSGPMAEMAFKLQMWFDPEGAMA